jgi:hypothetical protein
MPRPRLRSSIRWARSSTVPNSADRAGQPLPLALRQTPRATSGSPAGPLRTSPPLRTLCSPRLRNRRLVSAGFLAELNPSGSALLYSTFTGGLGMGAQIALDSTGAIYEADVTPAGVAILQKYSPGGTAILYRQEFASGSSPFVVSAAGEVTILSYTSAAN